MSKSIFLLFAYMTLVGCSIGSLAKKKTPYIYKKPYHYGILNKNILMNHEGYPWFLNQYDKYQPSIEKLSQINFSKIKIKIFMGTWCHDSKREIPRLIKILDNLIVDQSNVEIIGLTKEKKGYFNDYNRYNITNTPTIIFYNNKKEVGRIIEKPEESLESNMVSILANKI